MGKVLTGFCKKKLFSVLALMCLFCSFLFSRDISKNGFSGPVFVQASDRQVPSVIVGKSENPVTATAFSPDGKRFLSTWGNYVLYWSSSTNRLLTVCTGHKSPVIFVSFSPDGKYFLSLSEDGTIIIRYSQNCKDVVKIKGNKDAKVLAASFTNDGSSVVVPLNGLSLDYCFRLIMTKDFLVSKMDGHKAPVYSMDYCAKTNRLISADTDGSIRLWNLNNFACEAMYDFYPDSKVPVVINPKGENFLSMEKKDTLVLRNLHGSVLLRIREPEIAVNAAAFSPDGNSFAIALKNGGIKTYDIRTGLVTHFLDFDTKNEETAGRVNSLSYSPDGRQMIAGTVKGYLFRFCLNGTFTSQPPEDPYGLDDEVRNRVGEVLPLLSGEKDLPLPGEKIEEAAKEEIALNNQFKVNKGRGPALAEGFIGAGYSMLSGGPYIGSVELDVLYQQNFKSIPLILALEGKAGVGLPIKDFPYTYYFEDGIRAKNPYIYTFKPGLDVGFELYSLKNLRVFVEGCGGLTYRVLWNNSTGASVKSDFYKGFYGGLSTGADLFGLTLKFDFVYDSILKLQPSLSLGYTFKRYEKVDITKRKKKS
ncbi:MAG: hypothetical protein MJ188_01470 [Treponema sp.]|nr:hypothetical protein [Treponema sp.]